MAKVYEAKGGDYKDNGSNPNESSKGTPKPKKSAIESGEVSGNTCFEKTQRAPS